MGITLGRRGWFRAPARCRSEAPTGRTGLVSLPRDAGRRLQRLAWRCEARGLRPRVGMTLRRRGWFRAPARCRSETGAPRLAWRWEARGLRPRVGMTLRHWGWFRAHARCRSETGAPSETGAALLADSSESQTDSELPPPGVAEPAAERSVEVEEQGTGVAVQKVVGAGHVEHLGDRLDGQAVREREAP